MLDALVPSVVYPPAMADSMLRVPVAPGCIYFGFRPSSLVLTRAASASEMHWASMAMHYTASLPSMQAESEGKVKWDGKKKEYKCPCPQKVCNYPVFARVRCIVCASAIYYYTPLPLNLANNKQQQATTSNNTSPCRFGHCSVPTLWIFCPCSHLGA